MLNNDVFFSIASLMTITKFKYYTNDKVVLYFSDAVVTFQRWEGDSTSMQISVETPSNAITCMLGSLFMVSYNRNDETLNIAGTDVNGKEYRYTLYVGVTLLQHEVSLDELLEDDSNN